MEFWENVKKDLDKAWHEGIAAVKDGSRFAARKVDQLTQEGKKRYRAFDLKTDVHREMGELGGLVYSLKEGDKNPLDDRRVKALVKKIDKLKVQIDKLEASSGKTVAKRKPAKRGKAPARKKAAPKKTADE